MFVYLIVNDVNRKVYIGKTTRPNLRQYFQQKCHEASRHISKNSRLYAAIRKYGREHFCIRPLVSCLATEWQLNLWEKALIYAFDSRNPKTGYNICHGGEGNSSPTPPETRAKIRESLKKVWSDPKTKQRILASALAAHRSMPSWHTPEGIERLRRFHTGRRHTSETRQRIREIRTGTHWKEESREKQRQNRLRRNDMSARSRRMWNDPKMRQVITGNRKKVGYSCSPETRARLSEAGRRHWADPGARRAASERAARLRYRHTPEAIERIRQARLARTLPPKQATGTISRRTSRPGMPGMPQGFLACSAQIGGLLLPFGYGHWDDP